MRSQGGLAARGAGLTDSLAPGAYVDARFRLAGSRLFPRAGELFRRGIRGRLVPKEWWSRLAAGDTARVFFVGAGSVLGLFFVHPLTAPRVAGTLVVAALLLVFPASWYRRNLATLGLELAFGILLNLVLVPGLGIFPLFVVASDVGVDEFSQPIEVLLFVVMGVAAAWGFMEVPGQPVPWSELLLLSAIFAVAMWSSGRGNREHQRLTEAYERLQEAQAEVRELAGLQERERIAQDLHDVLGHTLTLMILKGQLIRERLRQHEWAAADGEAAALLGVARKSLDDVRHVVEGGVATLEGDSTLADLCRAMEEAGLAVDVSWHPAPSWPRELEADILRITQEAVTNILRHAGASAVRLTLTGAMPGRSWRLEIMDNGDGMRSPEGVGIAGLRRRASTWGGAVTIEAGASGRGTRLLVTGFEVQHG